MDVLHIVLPILVGGIIGYCTNYIAIKMLFRPYKAVYIGKWRIPFTPGIIPKNQKRLAGAIGKAVSGQLLTKEALMESIDKTGEKYITEITERIYESDSRILDILPEEIDREKTIESISDSLSEKILEKAKQINYESVAAQFTKETLDSLLAGNPMFGMLLNADIQNVVAEKLGNAIRRYLNDHGEESVKRFVLSYLREQSDKPIKELISGKVDKEKLTEMLLHTTRSAFSKYGDEILNSIDVKGIVSQRIESMGMDELEELVMSVMKQELQAVINLGALIGAIIGTINIFL